MNITTAGHLTKLTYFECPAKPRIRPNLIPEDSICVELIVDGIAYLDDDTVRHQCTAGTIIWNIPGEETVHETEVATPYRCYAFNFKDGYCGREIPRISLWNPAEHAVLFGRECLESFHSNRVNREFLGNYVYAALLYHATKPQASMLSYPTALTRAMEFIGKYLNYDLSPEEIATASNISKPYLFSLFQKYLSSSPHQYILNQRLTKAKALLCTGNTPIKEIAEQCSFNSLEVFYRQFRKNTGTSPAQYRAKYSR